LPPQGAKASMAALDWGDLQDEEQGFADAAEK
jgi:hypothetical protein